MRPIVWFIAVLAALIGVADFTLKTPNTDPEEMHAKYGGDQARYTEAAGMRIHYRVSGPEDAPVLVLIHGTSASLHTWEPLRERLDADYRVIAYDQPGHGLTGPHPERDYTYTGMSQALGAIFEAEKISAATIIGNSMGGWVAWRAALAMPGQVDALVLIDPSGGPMIAEAEGNLGFTLLSSPVGKLAIQRYLPRAAIESSLRQTTAVDDIINDAMIDRYWELTRYPGNRQAAGDQFTSPRQDLFGEIGKISVPTLILWGEEDGLIPAESAATFDEAIPGSELRLYPGVGHLPMEEVPDTVAFDVREFLERKLDR